MSGFSGIFPEYVLSFALPNHKSVNSRAEWLHGWVLRMELAPLILEFNLVEKKIIMRYRSNMKMAWIFMQQNLTCKVSQRITNLFIHYIVRLLFLLILAKKWFFSCHNFNHGLRSNYSNAVHITHRIQPRQKLM